MVKIIKENCKCTGILTSNYRERRHPDQPMNLIVLSIVGGVNEQNSIVSKCIIASNDKVGNNAIITVRNEVMLHVSVIQS